MPHTTTTTSKWMTRFSTSIILCLTILGYLQASIAADVAYKILPDSINLLSPIARQHVLLQSIDNKEMSTQIEEGIIWEIENPKIATLKNGVVKPVTDGKTTLAAYMKQGDEKLKLGQVDVSVMGMQKKPEWKFRKHILPILSKQNCNSGGCHGALAGKGGFRLSLQGYNPEDDFFNISKQDRGRRIDFVNPAKSLFLLKPTGAIPHKGGVKLKPDSEMYQTLADWISTGANPPSAEDPAVSKIDILPKEVLLNKGDVQHHIVTAHYSDGSKADVTHLVRWSSTNEAVAQVDEDGKTTIVGPGVGAIVAWYDSKLSIGNLTVAYAPSNKVVDADKKTGKLPPAAKPVNFIDENVDRLLTRLNLDASPNCKDSEFVRRVYIDTLGRLPTATEAKTFLVSIEANKRELLIDELLASGEFADYWTYKWSDMLMLNGTILRPLALKAYYDFIHKHVEKNTPWDQFVREIVTATGESTVNGATNFYAVNQTPEEMTENACKAFMGLSIGCAKCHNHPLEKWTNDQYYAVANMFSRVKAKGWGGDGRNGDGARTLYVATDGELVQPRTGKPQQPCPLDGEPLSFDNENDRRIYFAKWLTSPENPYFTRVITNRIWANYMGVGLVENIDDLRVSNPATNERLLSEMSEYLKTEKYDLKKLMKLIMLSNAYQRSSKVIGNNRSDTRFYSHYYPRRMMAEVLHDAIVQVTAVPTKFDKVELPGKGSQKTDFYPLGTKAIQLYDAAIENYFLDAFGRNKRMIVCECERTEEPSIVQVLHIANGNTINQKLKSKTSAVAKYIKLRELGNSDEGLLDDIYLSCLARYPTAREKAQLVSILPPPGDKEERIVIEDILWGIMSSREFLFNH